MRILSFDVGIKNLAFCLIKVDKENKYTIENWEVINLCPEDNFQCTHKTCKKLCNKKAKFKKNSEYYCSTHANQSEFKIPTSDLFKLSNKKYIDLKTICSEHDIDIKTSNTKIELLGHIDKILKNEYLEVIDKQNANSFNLIQLGVQLKKKLDEYNYTCENIDQILIENQISPIANRMKTLQGMICQYFIMKNITNIMFVSSANKLKNFIGNQKTSYNDRKKLSIKVTSDILQKDILLEKWLQIFNKSSKKDDLGDCFLQIIWYISEYNKHCG